MPREKNRRANAMPDDAHYCSKRSFPSLFDAFKVTPQSYDPRALNRIRRRLCLLCSADWPEQEETA